MAIANPTPYKRFVLWALALLVLPLLLQTVGSNGWVRIADMALLYVLLALGLNIVVGYAGLLDLGFVAFFAGGVGQRTDLLPLRKFTHWQSMDGDS